MALSSGMRQVAGVAAAWVVVGCSAAFTVAYFSEIKHVTRSLLGLPATVAVATTAPTRPERDIGSSGPALRGRVVEIRAGSYGHYYANAEINGRAVEVLVDTGASMVALSHEDAARAGIHIRERDYTQQVRTANGVARVAPVILDRVTIGNITVRDVPASVSEPGNLGTSLLGMSFLNRLQRVDMRAGVLVLQE